MLPATTGGEEGNEPESHSSIDREVAEELGRVCPSLAHLIANRYGGVSRIAGVNKDRKLVYIIESKRGVLQGDPLATAAFTRAHCEVLNQVRRQFPDVVIIGIADDTYYIAGVLRALAARALAKELAEKQLGLISRPDKDAAVARDPSQLIQAHHVALTQAQVPVKVGIEVVGVPQGSAAHVTAKLDEVVAGIQAKADALVQTQKASANTVQALVTSACLGLASMFNFLMRSLPPDTVMAHARKVDAISVACVRSLLGLSHVDLETAEGIEFTERLFLSEGGMRLQSCARAADAAYIGHWALIGPAVQKMLPHVQLTDPATMSLKPLAALKATAERVSAAAEEEGIKRVVRDLPLMLSNSARGLQGIIGKAPQRACLQRPGQHAYYD